MMFILRYFLLTLVLLLISFELTLSYALFYRVDGSLVPLWLCIFTGVILVFAVSAWIEMRLAKENSR